MPGEIDWDFVREWTPMAITIGIAMGVVTVKWLWPLIQDWIDRRK